MLGRGHQDRPSHPLPLVGEGEGEGAFLSIMCISSAARSRFAGSPRPKSGALPQGAEEMLGGEFAAVEAPLRWSIPLRGSLAPRSGALPHPHCFDVNEFADAVVGQFPSKTGRLGAPKR